MEWLLYLYLILSFITVLLSIIFKFKRKSELCPRCGGSLINISNIELQCTKCKYCFCK